MITSHRVTDRIVSHVILIALLTFALPTLCTIASPPPPPKPWSITFVNNTSHMVDYSTSAQVQTSRNNWRDTGVGAGGLNVGQTSKRIGWNVKSQGDIRYIQVVIRYENDALILWESSTLQNGTRSNGSASIHVNGIDITITIHNIPGVGSPSAGDTRIYFP